MKVAAEYTIDLGDLGERDCLIKGEVEEVRYFESRDVDYEVTIHAVTVPWLDDMNVSGLLNQRAVEIFSDLLKETYIEAARSVLNDRLEARAARHADMVRQYLAHAA